MTKSIKTLKNGVEMFSLEVRNDFEEAQEMLELASATDSFNAECVYNYRTAFDGLGTYKVKVERKEDYEEFIQALEHDKRKCEYGKRDIYINALQPLYRWFDDLSYYETYIDNGGANKDFYLYHQELLEKYYLKNCECKKHSFRNPTFEEWKSGKYQESEKRQIKLGKALIKAGFSQTVVDYYSAQVREEKHTYITISDRVQHIAGMSNYAKLGSWDGYNGTSCQDTRHDGEHCLSLLGSLHDDGLFIAMMHDELEEQFDMTDALKARVIMRLITVSGQDVLVPTTFYGNNKTKSALRNALNQLEEMKVFGRDAMENTDTLHRQVANGYANASYIEDIEIEYDEYTEVDFECPMCDGHGQYEVESMRDDSQEIDCPACNGRGEITSEVNVYVSEYIEVEFETEVSPYNEGYNHNGSNISIWIDKEYIRNALHTNQYA